MKFVASVAQEPEFIFQLADKPECVGISRVAVPTPDHLLGHSFRHTPTFYEAGHGS